MELDEYRRMAEVETSHWWYGATRSLLQQVLGPHLVTGGRFLDAGCGTGATGAWMGDVGHVVGLDMEPMGLRLYHEAHPRSSLAAGDVRFLPFADASFDAVLCVTVLCHRSIPSPSAVVGEFVRVLRPGGVLCLQEPGVRRLRRAHDRVTHTGRRFSRADLARLCADNGCSVLTSTGAYAFLVPPAAAKAVLERGRTASDLDRNADGLGGVLASAAAVERRVLGAGVRLPFGLSALAVARKR